ncbi:ATPase subunit of ABC transporter with duplicated ATPase domains [Spinactinospora alkalitolerans]|uniref:ATPase subunit of ABC transporter with duplicated ATPase domains n=1 Tax=Spinactinospora alkalitolerans TaxID=687207 RepID=A0A852TTI7_9ACTN|nr:ABC-F family ATP-binding cassette domain-containing protein [Spinactinospora alkalitolerans]NYE46815.1 ATPase subunit of ABC transporter with duplicated ATPase domains [Spinactinospora alkalitolerans]
MLTASDLELRVGARLLLEPTGFRVAAGDRIGLVGRNGAGKTTMTKVLAGEASPSSGRVTTGGTIGYLPQDPRTGDLDVIALDRVLSARGLDEVLRKMRVAEEKMASDDPKRRDQGVRAYARMEERLHVLGGYAAESEAASIAAGLGLPNRVLSQPLHTLSGGQRRRVELARILFSGADTLLLDEPTNHLDGDSIIWLRDFLKSHQGGLIVISHDVELVEHVVNKVFYLDANRCVIDIYNMGWRAYLAQREADERRRRREQANAEKQASALQKQADRFRAKATKAKAAQQMQNRAERILGSVSGQHKVDRVAKLRFPDPAPSGRTPLTASGLSKSYGSLEIFAGVDLAIDRGSRVVILGLNGAGKTTLLRILAGVEKPDTGEVAEGHGLRLGYYAQEHETLDVDRSVLENMMSAAPDLPEVEARRTLGSFLFTGDDVDKPAGVLSGGEKTRLALATLVVSSANVLLLDEPTNNLDPASREEILSALRNYKGAIVLVTHDEGAVDALQPERVILLPDGVEDVWNAEFTDLIALA